MNILIYELRLYKSGEVKQLVEFGYRERFTEFSGKKICYVDEGAGPVILLVHGLGSTLANWGPTIESLKRDFRVIALDMPGCGKSDFIDTDLTPDFYAGVVLSLLDHLEVERVVTTGHSMGGVVVLNLALFHRNRVNGLVLVDAAGSHRIPDFIMSLFSSAADIKFTERVTRFTSNPARARKLAKYRFIQRRAGVYHTNEYTEFMLTNGIDLLENMDVREYLKVIFRSGRQTLRISYYSMLGEIDVPTLIAWGQEDPFLSIKIGQRFNNRITGSLLAAIPEAGHIPQLEQPDLFNDAMKRFLRGACG